jgi:hypothetical protein
MEVPSYFYRFIISAIYKEDETTLGKVWCKDAFYKA